MKKPHGFPRRTFHLLFIAAFGILMTGKAIASADSGTDSNIFSISGYGTIGAVHSTERNADFITSTFQPKGAGYTDAWSFAPDSRLGVQANFNFTSRLSAVIQLVSEQRYDNSYRPGVEWANVKYQVTPDFSIRIGRIALPGLMASEYRKVGYAMPWVRPPRDTYSLSPVTNSDGIDASYRFRVGERTNTIQAYYGQKDMHTTLANHDEINARAAVGVTDTLDLGAVSMWGSYHQGRMTMPSAHDFFDLFRQFGARGNQIADQYDLYHKRYRLMSLGANYDPGNWFLTGEWERLKTNSWAGDGTGWYISSGYRIKHFTPYVIYSRVRMDSPMQDAGLPTAYLPPMLAAPATQLNGLLNSFLLNYIPDERTAALGTRWDFARNLALKAQFEHVQSAPGTHGLFTNRQAEYMPGGQANVVSITMDFVF